MAAVLYYIITYRIKHFYQSFLSKYCCDSAQALWALRDGVADVD